MEMPNVSNGIVPGKDSCRSVDGILFRPRKDASCRYVPPESKIGERNGKKVRLPKGGSPLFQVFFPVAMILGYPGLFLFSVGFQHIKLLTSRNKNGTAAPPSVSCGRRCLRSLFCLLWRAFPCVSVVFLRRDRKAVVRKTVCVGWNASLGRNTFGTISETLLWPMSPRCRDRKMKKADAEPFPAGGCRGKSFGPNRQRAI